MLLEVILGRRLDDAQTTRSTWFGVHEELLQQTRDAPAPATDIRVRKLRGMYLFLAGFVHASDCGNYVFVEKKVPQVILASMSTGHSSWPELEEEADMIGASDISLLPMIEQLATARAGGSDFPVKEGYYTVTHQHCLSCCLDSIRRHPGTRPCKHVIAAQCSRSCDGNLANLEALKLEFGVALQNRERLLPKLMKHAALYGSGRAADVTSDFVDHQIAFLKLGNTSRSPQSPLVTGTSESTRPEQVTASDPYVGETVSFSIAPGPEHPGQVVSTRGQGSTTEWQLTSSVDGGHTSWVPEAAVLQAVRKADPLQGAKIRMPFRMEDGSDDHCIGTVDNYYAANGEDSELPCWHVSFEDGDGMEYAFPLLLAPTLSCSRMSPSVPHPCYWHDSVLVLCLLVLNFRSFGPCWRTTFPGRRAARNFTLLSLLICHSRASFTCKSKFLGASKSWPSRNLSLALASRASL